MNPDPINNAIIGLIILVCLLFALTLVLSIITDTSPQDNVNETNDTNNNQEDKKVDPLGLFYTIFGILGIGSGLTILALFYNTYIKP